MAKSKDKQNAAALLNYARRYQRAAELLFEKDPTLAPPIKFLYFHSVELLLRAYLVAKGKTPRKGHQLVHLYKQAKQLGLSIKDDALGPHNVVSLLESGNRDSAFRYYTLESRTEPDMNWAREVIADLLSEVTPVVEATRDPTTAGKPVKFNITWSIPSRRKRQP